MATLRIIANRNIRMNVDVVADELLATVETDHNLQTLMSMIQQRQARIETDEPKAKKKPASAPSTAGAAPDETANTTGSNAPPPDSSLVPNRPLFDFPELDEELRDLLAAAVPPITTLRQATEYIAANGKFTPITGIGKVGDAKIKAALGL